MTSKAAEEHVKRLVGHFTAATIGKMDTTEMLAVVIAATTHTGAIRTTCTALRAEARGPATFGSAVCSVGVCKLEMLLVGLHAQTVCAKRRGAADFQELVRVIGALNKFSVRNGVAPRYNSGHDLQEARARALRAICEDARA